MYTRLYEDLMRHIERSHDTLNRIRLRVLIRVNSAHVSSRNPFVFCSHIHIVSNCDLLM